MDNFGIERNLVSENYRHISTKPTSDLFSTYETLYENLYKYNYSCFNGTVLNGFSEYNQHAFPLHYEHVNYNESVIIEICKTIYDMNSFLFKFLKNVWTNKNKEVDQIIELQGFEIMCQNNNNVYDSIDIQAYLHEIDLNLQYFNNECNDFNMDHSNIDYNVDTMLSFHFAKDACNIFLYEKEVTKQLHSSYRKDFVFKTNYSSAELPEIFANIDSIPEFYPILEYSEKSNNEDLNHEMTSSEFLENFSDETQNFSNDIFENVYNYSPNLKLDELDIHRIIKNDFVFTTEEENFSSSSSSSATLNASKFIMSALNKSPRDSFRKPCVYLLNEGKCMRVDCRFAHDLHNITCKYWLEGECLKGNSCEFLHNFQTNFNNDVFHPDKFNDSQSNTVKGFSLNKSEFPELGINSLPKNDENSTTKVNNNELCENHSGNLKLSVDESKTCDRVETSKAIKKSRKFRDNVLCSLSLPTIGNTCRKKNIN